MAENDAEAGAAAVPNPTKGRAALVTSGGHILCMNFEPQNATALHNGKVVDLKEDHSKSKWWWIFDPLHPARMLWDVFTLCFIVYEVIIIPVEIGFVLPDYLAEPFNVWWWIELFIGIAFSADILINCLTAYIRATGAYVWNPRKIVAHYFCACPFSGMFDVVAQVPFILMIVETIASEGLADGDSVLQLARLSRMGKIGFYLRILRALRLIRIFKAMNLLDMLSNAIIFSGRYAAAISAIFKIIVVFTFIIHLVSCFYAVASHDFDEQVRSDVGPFSENLDPNLWNKYSFAFWWSVVTLAGGSPPTSPLSQGDIWLDSLVMGIFVVATNTMIGILCAVFDKFWQSERDLHERMEVATKYITRHRLNPILKGRVLNSIRNAFVQERDEGNFAETIDPLLSEDLRRKVKGAIYGSMLRTFPPFAEGLPPSFFNKLAYEAETRSYIANDMVFMEGESATTMVFVTSGTAMIESSAKKFRIPFVTKGWWLNEDVLFAISQGGLRRSFDCVALGPCTTLEISREGIEHALKVHAGGTRWLDDYRQESRLPLCPVCAGRHDVWECSTLVEETADDEEDGEAAGEMHVEEISASARRRFKREENHGSSKRSSSPSARQADLNKILDVMNVLAGQVSQVNERVQKIERLVLEK